MIHHDRKAVRVGELFCAAKLELLDRNRRRDVVADDHIDGAFDDLSRENRLAHVLAKNFLRDRLLHKISFISVKFARF